MGPFVLSLTTSPKLPKKRAASYGGLGGFVTIEDLQNDHDDDNHKSSWPYRKRRNLSPRSGGEHKQHNVNDNVLMSPFRSEGWRTPETPPTPTPSQFVHNVSPIEIDLQCCTSDIPYQSSSANAFTASSCSLDVAPVELAGSLLLPSQGFTQSNPPLVPPRRRPALRKSSKPSTDSSPPPLSASSSPDSEMSNPMHITESFSENGTMLRRTSTQLALHENTSESTMTLRSGCPIPLSQMTVEDLMAILPNLDAAIIAHDWIPCMQKRHKELNKVYQRFVDNNQASNDQLTNLDKDLLTILNESQHLAATFTDLFKHAEELAARDDESRTADAQRTRTQLSECLRVLARQNMEKKEQASQYAIDLKEYQHRTRNAINMFSNFIHENLGEALEKAPADQVHQIAHVMADSTSDWLTSGDAADASPYAAIRQALQECQDELRDAREIVYEQQAMIKAQSQKLEEYHNRFTVVATQARKQGQQVHSYQKTIDELQAKCSEDQSIIDQLRARLDNEHETNLELRKAKHGLAYLERQANSQESLKDAEISNLRRKLEKAYTQENKLQAQVRDLVSICNKPDTTSEVSPNEIAEIRPGLLKRLFASHPKDTQSQPGGIPRDVSKLVLSLPNSPAPDGMPPTSESVSSHLGSSADPSGLRVTGRPYARSRQTQQHRRNSFELPARLREALNSGGAPEINDAVVHRFVSPVPRGLQSRQQVAGNSRSKSDDGVVHTYARVQAPQRQSRPDIHLELEPRGLDTTLVPSGHRTRTPTPNDASSMSPFGTSHNRVLSGITEVSEHSNEPGEPNQAQNHVVGENLRGRDTNATSQSSRLDNSRLPLPASASDIQIYRQSLNTLERLDFD